MVHKNCGILAYVQVVANYGRKKEPVFVFTEAKYSLCLFSPISCRYILIWFVNGWKIRTAMI